MSMAKVMVKKSPKFGILLGGTWGNGKTTMMKAFRRAVNEVYNSGGFSGVMDEYWKPEFQIVEAEEFNEIARDRKEFKKYASIRMLGIDDLGKESARVMDYGTVLEPIKRLLEIRYSKQLFTFITTNKTRQQLDNSFDGHIGSRLEEMFHRIGFSSEIDYRKITD